MHLDAYAVVPYGVKFFLHVHVGNYCAVVVVIALKSCGNSQHLVVYTDTWKKTCLRVRYEVVLVEDGVDSTGEDLF